MEQEQHIRDLRDRDRVHSIFLVSKKSQPVGKSGKAYLAFTLTDKSGELEARAWDNAEALGPLFAQGDFVRVKGTASLYNGRIQLKVDAVERVEPGAISAEDFLPSTRFDVDQLFAQVRALVVQVQNPHICELLLGFLDDPELGPAFRRAPAAKGVHHPFLGGLCEHTLSVLQLGWRICDHYPQLDRDLITAGCLLHDLGKTRELTHDTGFDYTEEGRLVGHLVMTCQWIHERAQRIPGFPRELEWHLTHLVAAHHGQLEFGSPKVPHTQEAMVVHALDELDSRINSFGLIFARDRGPGPFTDYQRLYDRYLFKGPSWNGVALPADERRFQGPGLYQEDRPRQHELFASAPKASPPARPKAAAAPANASTGPPDASLAPEGAQPPAPPSERPARPGLLDLFAAR